MFIYLKIKVTLSKQVLISYTLKLFCLVGLLSNGEKAHFINKDTGVSLKCPTKLEERKSLVQKIMSVVNFLSTKAFI